MEGPSKLKVILAIQGVQKKQNGLILVKKKLRYKDMIKIFGTLKSFAFLKWYICLAFSKKNGFTKLIQGHLTIRGVQKIKMALL